MYFDLTDDQIALRDGIRALLEGRFGIERVRGGFDRSMWAELGEAGVFSLCVDGFTWADAAIVFEELGRALVPGPLVGTFLADPLIEGTGRGARVIGGIERPTEGEPIVVEHLDALDALVVVNPTHVALVDPSVLRAHASEWPLDPLTPVAIVDELPAGVRLADADVIGQWQRSGALLTAALEVGLSAFTGELAVAYSKERLQFDRPIGSFQAVKHILADTAVRTELARVAVHSAAVHLDDPEIGDVDRAVSVAKLLAGEAAIQNGTASTQVHGGMGFTWEVDVHLALKRAWVHETHFGGVDHHADAVAATLPT
ncbi:MAG: acyl-CoA dehydrogenase family protein [Acidimicrobiia bacterium]